MACYIVYAKDKIDFIKIQLTAFSLGFSWLNRETEIDTKFRNYIYLYTTENSKSMTKGNTKKDYGGMTNEPVTYLLIEDFLKSNPNDF